MQLNSQELFNTVPTKNYLSLSHNNETDYERVIEFLNFKKKDVATAAAVPFDSVRYDEKMPAELKERIEQWANLMQLVAEHFKNTDKTLLWFKMPNPMLGNVAPKDMIRYGRYKKLFKFVIQALQANQKA
jgi:uncharacterized protein (DUF2384 family)